MDSSHLEQDTGSEEMRSVHIGFPDSLRIMLDVSNRLAAAPSVDALCRLAIELGRSELGFDRLGIWFRSTDDPDMIVGTYGTDETGHIRDEHGRTVWVNSDEYLQKILSSRQAAALRRTGKLYNDQLEAVGEGIWASAVMWDGNQVIGYVMMDNLLTRQPIDDGACELLAMFAATLGHLCSRKQAEEALQKSEAQLRHAQKMEALGRLAGGIAHDFNNLLTTILGYSQLALDSVGHDDSLYADLSEVVRAGTRAAELTSRLLSFGSRHTAHAAPTNINQVVEETDRLLQHTLGQHIELVSLLSQEPGVVVIDSGQVQQIIMNLAINARDAMPNGGRLVIETRLLTLTHPDEIGRPDIPPDDYAVLSIADSGVGMSGDVLEHIFEPFFTTKDAEKGTGLGLSIVYGIVTQNNGYIDVASELGKGTTFTLYFPRIIGIDPVETIKIRRQLQHGNETILVVEDEDSVRKFAVNVLKSLGYRVLQAGSGAEALLMFARHKDIDLVFTDIIMPGMNGKELVERLCEGGHAFKAVYASGFSGDLLKDHAQERSIPLLQKPYGRDQLSYTIRQVLDGKKNALRAQGDQQSTL
ncbi:MAG: response regulator [Spartobacteria bacterium]|nr:response regulator [Spartobacteria bacterium]